MTQLLSAIAKSFMLTLLLFLFSCSSYKQNIMFKSGKNFNPDPITKEVLKAEKNYVIQSNDYLKLEVFSSNGERAIDPDGELVKQMGSASQVSVKPQLSYLVNIDGIAKFPMIGEVRVADMSLMQAEAALQKLYDIFYKNCFVSLTFLNKRVTVLGAVGGQVIPLPNQNINLVEVLALAKGLGNDAKAHKIKVLRNEQVFEIDLSTIGGFKNGNMTIQPGDIVYVEPVRRPFPEAFKDFGPLFSLMVSSASLIIVLLINNQK
jgi:polysaccharide export outer membrane protein